MTGSEHFVCSAKQSLYEPLFPVTKPWGVKRNALEAWPGKAQAEVVSLTITQPHGYVAPEILSSRADVRFCNAEPSLNYV